MYVWFTQEDVLRLQERDCYVPQYEVPRVEAESDDYKWYERFEHYAAASASMTKTRTIILDHVIELPK